MSEIQTRHVLDFPDALKDVPGVFAETRYGQEVRLSIRGSSLTRFFHLRGIELLQDGIPVNLADGSGASIKSIRFISARSRFSKAAMP